MLIGSRIDPAFAGLLNDSARGWVAIVADKILGMKATVNQRICSEVQIVAHSVNSSIHCLWLEL